MSLFVLGAAFAQSQLSQEKSELFKKMLIEKTISSPLKKGSKAGDAKIVFEVTNNQYYEENFFGIFDHNTFEVILIDSLTSKDEIKEYSLSSDGCYIFYLMDAEGDGFVNDPSQGEGSYTLKYVQDGQTTIIGSESGDWGDQAIYLAIGGNCPQIDVVMDTISTRQYVAVGNVDISGRFRNNGQEVINSFDVSYRIVGVSSSSEYHVSGLDILSGKGYDFVHNVPCNFTSSGVCNLEVTISNINGKVDEKPEDNVMSKQINVILNPKQRTVLLEGATNTACGPCAAQYPIFDELVGQNTEKVAVIKYHYNYPDLNDPFLLFNQTHNLGRLGFYGVQWTPIAFMDGASINGDEAYDGAPVNLTQEMIDDQYSLLALFDINVSNISVVNSELTVEGVITAQADLTSPSIKYFIAVLEDNLDYPNGPMAPNGETHFDDVLRKMLPTYSGMAMGLQTTGNQISFSQKYVMPGDINQEEIKVYVFVQDVSTKEIFQTVVVKPISILSASIENVHHLNCNGGSTASAEVVPEGGTAPYTYNWSNGAVGATAQNLTAGTYFVTVQDANEISVVSSVIITEPDPMDLAISTSSSSCGNSDGSITIDDVLGGSPLYTYLWSNNSTNVSIANLSSGAYSVTVTDALGCSLSEIVTISDEGAPSISLVAKEDVKCNGGDNGSIQISASGGVAPYSYNWENGNASATMFNLTAGSYLVTVSDNNGCEAVESVTITEPLPLTIHPSITNPTCGNSDGSIILNANGGTPLYSFSVINKGITTELLGDTHDGIDVGVYSFFVKDGNNCNASGEIILKSLGGPVVDISYQKDVSCYGKSDGIATVNTNSVSSPFTYFWDDESTQTTATATNLATGEYSVVVTDANDCVGFTSVIIDEPASMNLTVSSTKDEGFGNGSATVNVTGGASPYRFLWSDVSAQITQTAISLSKGLYTVNVSDNNNCSTTKSVTVDGVSSIDKGELSLSIKIFPNPTTGTLNIESAENSIVHVYNMVGVEVMREEMSNITHTLDIKALAEGTYLIRVISEHTVHTETVTLVK